MGYRNRVDAGRRLAEGLAHLRGTGAVVVGVPRGGVPVAAEVARAWGAPLDMIVVGKVGVPWQPELAMGAVGEDGVWVVDRGVAEAAGVEPGELFEAQHRAPGRRLVRRTPAARSAPPPARLAAAQVVADRVPERAGGHPWRVPVGPGTATTALARSVHAMAGMRGGSAAR